MHKPYLLMQTFNVFVELVAMLMLRLLENLKSNVPNFFGIYDFTAVVDVYVDMRLTWPAFQKFSYGL